MSDVFSIYHLSNDNCTSALVLLMMIILRTLISDASNIFTVGIVKNDRTVLLLLCHH